MARLLFKISICLCVAIGLLVVACCGGDRGAAATGNNTQCEKEKPIKAKAYSGCDDEQEGPTANIDSEACCSELKLEIADAIDKLEVGLQSRKEALGYIDAMTFLEDSIQEEQGLRCIVTYFDDTRWTKALVTLDPERVPKGFQSIGSILMYMVIVDVAKAKYSYEDYMATGFYPPFKDSQSLSNWIEKLDYNIEAMRSKYAKDNQTD